MYNIPVFDSLTHPTIDTNWTLPKYSKTAGIESLIKQMDENNISRALAVGMKGIGSYDEVKYIKLINPYFDRLIPVSFFDLYGTMKINEAFEKLVKIKNLGYKGIKLHPRISGFDLSNQLLSQIVQQANELQLNVLMCTYFYGKGITPGVNYFDQLPYLLYSLKGAKVILLHGCSVRLLELTEIVRSYENVLMDLSFTLCKYKESSMDLDIQYLFNSFDRRICIGSDFPEFSLKELRNRFDYFSKNLLKEKAENIGFKNITKFLKI
jgi:predicted TIM-barrel fold metal-dependent hydrolase